MDQFLNTFAQLKSTFNIISVDIMGPLETFGLEIDEKENLRIISSKTEKGSIEISSKTKLILSDLNKMMEKMDTTINLIESLDKHTKELKVLRLAAKISKLVD